jgi:hypothetical protein
MHFHHFALGQIVRLMAREGDAPDKMAKYKVTTLLPSESSSAIASNMKRTSFPPARVGKRPDRSHPPGIAN